MTAVMTKIANGKGQGNDVGHCGRAPAAGTGAGSRPARSVVQHQGKAQEEAEEHGGRDIPSDKDMKGFDGMNWSIEVEIGFCSQVLGAKNEASARGGNAS